MGWNTAQAEIVTPYEVDFNTTISTTDPDFTIAPNWSTYNLAVTGTVLDPSKNFITFDDGAGNAYYPQGSVRYNVNINSEGSGSDKNYYLQGGSDTNPLYITPLMTATDNESITFDAEYINFSSGKVEVMISTDRQNWTTIQTISSIASSNNWTTYTATIPEAGDYYIGFKVTSAKIDNIYGLVYATAPAHDLLLIASNIPTTGKQNHDYVATASIGNVGPNVETAGSYTATLYVDGEAVATSNAVDLPVAVISGNYNNAEEGNYTVLSFTFRPHFIGEKPVYIEVASGDAVVTTAMMNVNFAEEIVEGNVAISGTNCSNASLLHLNYNNSESVTLYTSTMLLNAGLKKGDVIESITFKGYCTNTDDYDTQLSVWYEKTTETEQAQPADGVYDTSNMTQVLSETHTWTKVGTSTELVDLITINLANPIVYDGTSSLRFLVRSEGSVYKSGTYFEVTGISGNGKSYYNRNDDYSSFVNKQKWVQNSVPAIHFGLKVKPKTFSGVVTRQDGTTPVVGATVTIRNAENDVEYFATTDGNGAYTIGVVQNTLAYTATVTAEGYETLVDNEELHFTENNQSRAYQLTPLSVAVTIGQYGYATFYYSNSAYVIPEGVEAKAVGSINGETLTLMPVYSIIPAGCAVILKAEPGDYTFVPTSEAGTAMENMLRGTDETKTKKPEEQECKYYKLAVNNDGVVGFYYGADDGAIFENEAHKAYLPVPLSLSNSVRSFTFNNASGLDNIQVSEAASPSYNLSGQRVNDAHKGVVILNGRKVLRK